MTNAVIYPKNPSLAVGAGVSGVSGILGLLDAFALPLNPQWKLAVAIGLAFLAPAAHSVITRSKVFSPDTVARMQAQWMALMQSAEHEQPEPVAEYDEGGPIRPGVPVANIGLPDAVAPPQ